MRMWTAVLCLAVLLAACSNPAPPPAAESDSDAATPTASDPTASDTPSDAVVAPAAEGTSEAATPSPSATPAAAATVGEDAPVGTLDPVVADHVEWALGIISGAEVTQEDFETRFAESFATQVPYEQFLAATEQILAAGPFMAGEPIAVPPRVAQVPLTAPDGAMFSLVVAVDDDDRIQGLVVQPSTPPTLEDPPATLEDAAARLSESGSLAMAAADVDGNTCTTTFAIDADRQAPIGSAFKLYVLAAVADAIAAGELGWDDLLTVTPEVRSLPSGELQTRPDGSEVSVREAAALMIQISDNTASDLLLRTVGRAAVEAAQAAYGHSDPAINQPFMTTLEFFALKADPGVADRYIAADESARREILEEIAGVRAADIPLATFLGDPLRPDVLEWFASPLDLCRVLATLVEQAATPGLEPLEEILTTNPGVADEGGRWARIAFKGGSEPGLLALAWLVEDDDGARRALTGSVVNTDAAFGAQEPTLVLLFAAARDLLAAS